MKDVDLNHLELKAKDGNLSAAEGRLLVQGLRSVQNSFDLIQEGNLSNISKDCVRGYFRGTVCE